MRLFALLAVIRNCFPARDAAAENLGKTGWIQKNSATEQVRTRCSGPGKLPVAEPVRLVRGHAPARAKVLLVV